MTSCDSLLMTSIEYHNFHLKVTVGSYGFWQIVMLLKCDSMHWTKKTELGGSKIE
jgi:hypothetical protein